MKFNNNDFEKLTNLIDENRHYFGDEEAWDIAQKIIEKFANGKDFFFKNTPPTWLDSELNEILEKNG